MNALLAISGSVVLITAALAGVAKWVIVPLWRITVRAGHFFDSWQGEPERDGLPARPGVVERITAIEYQLKPNDGGSMKDTLDRVERKVDTAAADAATVKAALEARQDAVEHELAVWRSFAARDVTDAANSVLNDRPDRETP